MRDQMRSIVAADRLLDALERSDPGEQERRAEEYSETFVQRAFEDKGALQTQFVRAADYTDEWFSGASGALRAYYVCMARTGPWDYKRNCAGRCGTLTRSDVWERLHADPLATGQRWYCGLGLAECPARYKTTWGMIVEFVLAGKAFYCRAPVCDFHAMDTKAMLIEQKIRHLAVTDPQALFAIIPRVAPVAVGTYFRQVLLPSGQPKEGVFRFDPEVYDEMPEMQWASLYCWAASPDPTPLQPGTAAWRSRMGHAGAASSAASTAAGEDDDESVAWASESEA